MIDIFLFMKTRRFWPFPCKQKAIKLPPKKCKIFSKCTWPPIYTVRIRVIIGNGFNYFFNFKLVPRVKNGLQELLDSHKVYACSKFNHLSKK